MSKSCHLAPALNAQFISLLSVNRFVVSCISCVFSHKWARIGLTYFIFALHFNWVDTGIDQKDSNRINPTKDTDMQHEAGCITKSFTINKHALVNVYSDTFFLVPSPLYTMSDSHTLLFCVVNHKLLHQHAGRRPLMIRWDPVNQTV